MSPAAAPMITPDYVYDHAFARVVALEEGYVNDPNDAGGETKYGISKAAYPDVDIKSLTMDEAQIIYKRDYWNPCACSQLPVGLSLMVFDSAVLHGVKRTILWLQDAIDVEADGRIGPKTITAAQAEPVQVTLLRIYRSRVALFRAHQNFGRFGTGWLMRLGMVLAEAVKVATYAAMHAENQVLLEPQKKEV